MGFPPDINNNRVLVTGGAGFIGSHLCEALLKRGFSVISVDNYNDFYDRNYKRDNIRCVKMSAEKNGGRFIDAEGDIRNFEFLQNIFSETKPDTVIHLAACAGVRPSIIDPVYYVDVNINGTVNVLECMKKQEVKTLLFASSSSVYGNNEKVPFSEKDSVDRPISPYAATKKAGELLCYTYHHLYGISTACLRFFTVYGPRQRPDLAIYKFTKLISEGKPLPFYGDGSTERDYTYISDIVDGIFQALEWAKSTAARYEIFNLGAANSISLSHLVELLENALGIKARLDVQPLQPGDVSRTFADIENSRSSLGYSPSIDIETGIRTFVEWYKQNRFMK